MKKINEDFIKKIKDEDPEAIMELFTAFGPFIRRKAKKIHDRASFCDEKLLEGYGYDSIINFINSFNIGDINTFEVKAKGYIFNEMLKDLKEIHKQIKEAVKETEELFEKKYACDDIEMTEEIIDRLKPPYRKIIVSSDIEEYVRKLLLKTYKISYNQIAESKSENDPAFNDRLVKSHLYGKVSDDPVAGIGIDRRKIKDSSFNYEDNFEELFKEITYEDIESLLSYLKPYQRASIRLKFGLFPDYQMSHDEISQLLLIPLSKIDSLEVRRANDETLNAAENNLLLLCGWIGEYQNSNFTEIASLYGCSHGTVSDRISTGLRRMKMPLWYLLEHGHLKEKEVKKK